MQVISDSMSLRLSFKAGFLAAHIFQCTHKKGTGEYISSHVHNNIIYVVNLKLMHRSSLENILMVI